MSNQRSTNTTLDFHPVTVADKALFERLVTVSECRNCDMSFANIFCWQDTYNSQIALYEGFLLIRFTTERGQNAYMQPIGEGDRLAVINALAADATQIGEPLRLFGLDRDWSEFLSATFGNQFAICNVSEHSDYIYLCSDLATLSGRKYQPKRNFINRFVSRYSYRFERINDHNLKECIAINNLWLSQRGGGKSAEQMAVARAFANLNTLSLEGWILYADNTPCAFAIGSPINHDTFCIHIEKVDTTFDGAGAMINNLVAVELNARFKYINREDDLGIEGLRRAKQSYHPVEMLSKYSALMITDHQNQIIDLWQQVFEDNRESIEEFMVRLFNPELCFTHTVDDKVVAMLHVVPLQSQTENIAYIYAVATAPEHRNQGMASTLMAAALESIDNGKYHFTALIPANEKSANFYSRFGFEDSGEIFNFSDFEINYDLGTGCSKRDIAMVRKNA